MNDRLSEVASGMVAEMEAYIDDESPGGAAAPERYFSSLTGTTLRTGFGGPQGGLFHEAPLGRRSATSRKRVRRTLGVTPHKGENVKREKGLSSKLSRGTVTPPALPCVTAEGTLVWEAPADVIGPS